MQSLSVFLHMKTVTTMKLSEEVLFENFLAGFARQWVHCNFTLLKTGSDKFLYASDHEATKERISDT